MVCGSGKVGVDKLGNDIQGNIYIMVQSHRNEQIVE